MNDNEKVFAVWRSYRPNPNRCKYTTDRKALISKRLKLGYDAADLIVVIRYFNESNSRDAKWMRGDNDRNRSYLDLENLFRVQKLGERVEAAHNWADKGGGSTPPPTTDNPFGDELDLGPLANF